MHLIRRAMLVCTVAALVLLSVEAAARADDTDAAQRAFIKDYVAALTSRNVAILRRLQHPATVACIADDNRDYFDALLVNDLRRAGDFAADYSVTRITALTGGAPSLSLPPNLLFYPAAPTHEFQIDTRNGEHRSLTLIRVMAAVDGQWFLIAPCPTPEGLQAFHVSRAERESQRARAIQLAADLREPLLSQVRTLLAQHRRIEAIQIYKSHADLDLTTASRVIDVLDGKQ